MVSLNKLINIFFNKKNNYPEGGEVYESLCDTHVSYLTHFMVPYTGGDRTVILKGERIILAKPNYPKATNYYCYLLNADEAETRIVPVSDRNNPHYDGFSLIIDANSLEKNFKPVNLMPINYKKGDATNPKSNKIKIIVHICNDVGGWGKGFVMAISKKWKKPELEYRKWYKNIEGVQTNDVQFIRLVRKDRYSNEKKFELGNVQFVKVFDDLWIANMIAQNKIRPNKNGLPPIRYSSVSECLERVRNFAKLHEASVHMPRIGCGLAGGEWSKIEELINNHLIAHGIETTVYDFE